MATDPDALAFPPGVYGGNSLTIREYFACHIMAGFNCAERSAPPRTFAAFAVANADALIAALNAPTVDKPKPAA